MTGERPTAVSLFSGCGGLDLGIHRAGFDFAFANDLDPLAAESHRANFPHVPFFEGSVAEITPELLASVSDGRAVAGRVHLLVGGPPCPPFSKSRFYRKDKPRGLLDPIGLETITGYLSVLAILEPTAFLLENVPGLAYGVHRDALDHIVQSAAKLGYSVRWKVLNAADYGVPQIRQRVFLVGVRDGSFDWPLATHAEDPADGLFSLRLARWRTAGAAISDLDNEENAGDDGHFAGGKHHHLLKLVPPGQNYLHFTAERGHQEPMFRWRSRYWSFLLKLSPDMPSWTIQAKRSNNMGPFHWRNRILRISEIKRLQTFPDDWVLAGKVEQQWRQVGNAVPPLLAESLGSALRTAIATAPLEQPSMAEVG